tara:strand:- start:448 stop:900 length:453 start_codon:yes stop_codon:yes gene_type:complete
LGPALELGHELRGTVDLALPLEADLDHEALAAEGCDPAGHALGCEGSRLDLVSDDVAHPLEEFAQGAVAIEDHAEPIWAIAALEVGVSLKPAAAIAGAARRTLGIDRAALLALVLAALTLWLLQLGDLEALAAGLALATFTLDEVQTLHP